MTLKIWAVAIIGVLVENMVILRGIWITLNNNVIKYPIAIYAVKVTLEKSIRLH
jgi:hypothetical protein